MSSLEKALSGNSDKQELPPTYDQVSGTNNASAPLLNQTFSGSIFGTSTIINLDLLTDSYSVRYSSCAGTPVLCDYSFLVRDFFGNVQAKASISNLNMQLEDVNGTEMIQIRLRGSMLSTNVVEYFMSKLNGRDVINVADVNTFEILQNRVPLGLIEFSKKERPELCLKIHHGHGDDSAEMVVKSLSFEDYAIFRDRTSATPLCNIQVPKYHRINVVGSGTGSTIKVIFHQETGITTEEQLLCTAAAIIIKASLNQLEIKNEVICRFNFLLWGTVLAIFTIALMTFVLIK